MQVSMEFLERGKEEWQMCQIVKKFVSENVAELKDDTKEYFENVGVKQSVVRLSTQLSKRFLPPSPEVVYLFARTCNVHTCVHFVNGSWSTVNNNVPYYVALELAAVGDNFVMLTLLDKEAVEVVVGQIQVCSHVESENDDDLPCDAASVCS